MTNSLFISTTEAGSGKALVSLGIIELLLRRTTRVHFFRPLIQSLEQPPHPLLEGHDKDEDIDLIVSHFDLKQTYGESFGLTSREANDLIVQHRTDEVIDTIISKFKALEGRGDFLLCEGSDYLGESSAFEFSFNQEIAKNLGAPVLILGTALGRSQDDAISPIQMAVDAFQEQGCDVAGIILNNAEAEKVDSLKEELYRRFGYRGLLLSVIPHHPRLASPRMRDIAAQLQAQMCCTAIAD
jgi:phosphate acetyltransferase